MSKCIAAAQAVRTQARASQLAAEAAVRRTFAELRRALDAREAALLALTASLGEAKVTLVHQYCVPAY